MIIQFFFTVSNHLWCPEIHHHTRKWSLCFYFTNRKKLNTIFVCHIIPIDFHSYDNEVAILWPSFSYIKFIVNIYSFNLFHEFGYETNKKKLESRKNVFHENLDSIE